MNILSRYDILFVGNTVSGSQFMKIIRSLVALIFCLILQGTELFSASALTSDKQIAAIDNFTKNTNAVTVYDITENKLIYSKNHTQKISVASTTKLATSLVALKYVHPDEIFTVGTELELVKPNSSKCLISKGHKLKLRTLIAGMLLPSGNDAAYTVAVNVARLQSGNQTMSDTEAVAYFCELMNEYCKEIGCKNTNFVNPEGWDNSMHYSTAEDMTLIAKEAVNNAIITSISCIQSQKFYFASGENITWENTNCLLDAESKYYLPYAKGLKTGTTNAAGKCLVTYAEVDGHKVIVTVYGAVTEDDRFGSTKNILSFLYLSPILGDVDVSGAITAADARLVLRASVGLETLTSDFLTRGDTDKDGKLSASDARTILRVSVGLETF